MQKFKSGVYFILFCLINTAAIAQEQTLSDTDREAIKETIQAQLDAFQADDAETAFSFATPGIQARFGTPGQFMAMVISSYQPVYRPKAVFFKDIMQQDGMTVQRVLLIDQNGQSVMAFYPMQAQGDGTWRIDGCYLAPAESQML